MRAWHCIGRDGSRAQGGETGNVPWWSFTKLVIATAALKLVEQGQVELDSPLPDRSYTLRQLLQHEAGLPDYGWLESYHSAVAAGEPAWTPDEMIARTLKAHPPWQPGSRWAYSNIGYYHAGEVIVAATGMKLGDALSALVLTPAGVCMAHLAASESGLDDVQMGDGHGYDPAWVLHGLLVGPLADAANFLHRLLSGKILDERVLAEMLRVRLLPQFRDELWQHPAYGLGLMGAWNGPGESCGHSGEGPGSGIAVYGTVRDSGVKVAACWQSPGAARVAEKAALELLRGP